MRSKEEKLELMDRIKTARKEGKTLIEACRQNKIDPSLYYSWKSKIKRIVSKPTQLVSIEYRDNNETTFMFYGKAKDLTHALDRLAQIGGK